MAICTWNRAALLDKTLARLAETRAGFEWEVVVVDNNCTDATPAVLARRARHLPLVAVSEPTPGHARARNRAVAAARGELVVWTDDDVLVGPDWLAGMVRAAEAYPGSDYFGGPVRPWFAEPPPRWARAAIAELGFCWALVDHGPATRELAAGEYAYGANFAVRLAALKRHPFDPNYGRVGARLSSGDDTRLQDALRAEGSRGVWVGSAAVEHFIRAPRVTPNYVREIAFWAGYHGYDPFESDASPKLWGAPRWLIWRRARLALKRRLLGLSPGRAWARALLGEAKAAGLIARFREELPS